MGNVSAEIGNWSRQVLGPIYYFICDFFYEEFVFLLNSKFRFDFMYE